MLAFGPSLRLNEPLATTTVMKAIMTTGGGAETNSYSNMKRALAALALVVLSGCACRKELCCPLDFRGTDTHAYPQADSRFYANQYACVKDAARVNSGQTLRINGNVVPYLGPEAAIPPQP